MFKRLALIITGIIFILILITSSLLYPVDYWDNPEFLLKNPSLLYRASIKHLIFKNHGEESHYLFFIRHKGKNYLLEYFVSENLNNFKGPFETGVKIPYIRGFIPQFDAVSLNGKIFLIWDSIDGAVRIKSGVPGKGWENERIIETGKDFCFQPKFFSIGGKIFITYHTESEGRRIDFYIVNGDSSLKNLTKPVRIAKEFAGSFFPQMFYATGRYFCVWQSRPFTEKKTPVFDIYLSFSMDGLNWSLPLNLTGDLPGEKKYPLVVKSKKLDRFTLIFLSDKRGTWGVYSREYNLFGKPLSQDIKINDSVANVRNFKLLIKSLPEDSALIFYTDERTGHYRLYYSEISGGKIEPRGTLKTGRDEVLDFDVLLKGAHPFVFFVVKRGIGYIGPDERVLPPVIEPVKRVYIGKSGLVVRWRQPDDPSGIEGFCYTFNKDPEATPEIVNLSPEVNHLTLIGSVEGKHYFAIRAKDGAGNLSKVVRKSFIVDLTPPAAPVFTVEGIDENGYFKDNSPHFKFKSKSSDVVGYNYTLTRRPVTIKKSRIRVKDGRVFYKNLGGGSWVLNVVAVDRAGNISETSHFTFKLRPLPKVKEKKELKKKIFKPWIISHEVYVESPLLSILLYAVLFTLLITVFIAGFSTIQSMIELKRKRELKMEESGAYIQVRKKRLGLRFKFSILIASLILILTVGISSVLSYVTIEKEKKALALQMIDKAKITLENITNVAREGILNNDELLLVSVIARTMKNKDIKYTIILDTHNRVIAHSDIEQKGKVLKDSFTEKASKADDIIIDPPFNPENLARLYNFASPVKFAGKRIGTVRIGYSTESIFNTIEESRRDSIYSTIVVTIITLIIGIIGAVIMATITIKPIKVLAEGAYIIGSGNLDHKIHVKAKDEIGLLAEEFNRMTERLKEYQKEMEKKAKLDEQIEIARSIQQNLIPGTGIDDDTVSIGGFYRAAVGVGGDYYDYIMKDSRYGLIISDVAGKGVPASLMMTMIRTVFRSLIHSGVMYPPRVVTLINNTLISDISSDRFATLLFGIYDSKKGVFQYTNAGYGPILLYRREKGKCFLVEPKKSSIPIGVMPDVEYAEELPLKLGSGDALILFTDGIHEARNEREEEYGMDRLAKIIPDFADQDASTMANSIVTDVLKFVGGAEQYDDMTLLVLKVK